MSGPKATPAYVRVLRRTVSDADGCWLFTGFRNANGYAQVTTGSLIDGTYRSGRLAHRVVFEALRGPIPAGLVLDHLCRNRACVNPEHLEPVSARVNFLRGRSPSAVTYLTNVCQRGHRMADAYVYLSGQRSCRECVRLRHRVRRVSEVESQLSERNAA